jgi:hypothetical protein
MDGPRRRVVNGLCICVIPRGPVATTRRALAFKSIKLLSVQFLVTFSLAARTKARAYGVLPEPVRLYNQR